jgi:hypothetical protein
MVTKSDDVVQFLTIEKTAELLNKSTHSVRQLMQRGKLKAHREGSRVYVLTPEVLTYFATKKQIPSWEENIENIKTKSFVSLNSASTALMVQPSYIIKLIQKKSLEGYVTVTGDVMISRDSINDYMRALENDTASKL